MITLDSSITNPICISCKMGVHEEHSKQIWWNTEDELNEIKQCECKVCKYAL